MMTNLDIKNTTKLKTSIPFDEIKNKILGNSYELSLVLIGDFMSARLNKKYKKREGTTNILSFEISKNEGEIFINVRKAQREAEKFGHSPTQHISFLFIHGCLHLKGIPHGDKMEKEEEKFLRKFS